MQQVCVGYPQKSVGEALFIVKVRQHACAGVVTVLLLLTGAIAQNVRQVVYTFVLYGINMLVVRMQLSMHARCGADLREVTRLVTVDNSSKLPARMLDLALLLSLPAYASCVAVLASRLAEPTFECRYVVQLLDAANSSDVADLCAQIVTAGSSCGHIFQNVFTGFAALVSQLLVSCCAPRCQKDFL